ncbi:polysaccharide pyruvyl transferase family protein [Spirosoma sp. KCTC 42546]|uniref:polysaccharide pyruvyl transferase family protein n=1 Tax=Spirosoma sp. KCTC 42546 TaxID=2520506 RepID=UPI0011596B56|nr:polysaccharide pyruvyl transferase family protein [Spirosoma sp. KCTC 42546]QDK78675.1 polysaccharide pyruvyl transferase family protein [Spirosoma sp. KCTC 42546]
MNFSKAQIEHRLRWIKQLISTTDISVIGGYHGGNLGDMALGYSVRDILLKRGLKSNLQTIYNLEKWTKTKSAIIGGGAIGYIYSLEKIANQYKGNYGNIGILGVDFNEPFYPQELMELLKNVAFISCRSKAQADKMMALTGRNDIVSHPDIAFSFKDDYCEGIRNSLNKSKKLLINIVPLYGKVTNGVLEPIEKYKEERSNLYENFQVMNNSYRSVLRKITEKALDEGFSVETIPFTSDDEEYGKLLLKGLSVKHNSYSPDPYKMLYKMANAEWALTTRYHSTIFAIKLGIKITPIAYATKNELMLNELGFKRDQFLTTDDLAAGIDTIKNSLYVDKVKINQWEKSCFDQINSCISRLP